MAVKPNEEQQAELERIRQDHGGILNPKDVVAAASDPSNPLHGCFTWDDRKAAYDFRLWEARQLIRVSVTVPRQTQRPTRAYVSLDQQRANGGGYRALAEVLEDDEAREQLLRQALRELKAIERKYRELKELAPIFEQAEQLRLDHAPAEAVNEPAAQPSAVAALGQA